MSDNSPAATESAVTQELDVATLGLIFNRMDCKLAPILACPKEEADDRLPSSQNLTLIRIDSVAFRDRRDIRKSLAEFYGVLHAMNERFWFIIRSVNQTIELYIGLVHHDNGGEQIAESDLMHCLLGVMPGCQATPIRNNKEKNDIRRNVLDDFAHSYLLTGVPTCQESFEKREQHQEEEKARTGIERLIDSMAGADFALSILCEPLGIDELRDFRASVADFYNFVAPLAKMQETSSSSLSNGGGSNRTITISKQEGTNVQTGVTGDASVNIGMSDGTSITTQVKDGDFWKRVRRSCGNFCSGGTAPSHGESKQSTVNVGYSKRRGYSKTRGENSSNGISLGETQIQNWNTTSTVGVNRERINMELGAVSELLAKLHKRLIGGSGQGMWKTCIMFHANKETVLKRAAYAAASIWGGDESAVDPIRCIKLDKGTDLQRTQMQLIDLEFSMDGDPIHPLGHAYSSLYTCLTHRELAHVADFPHWELPGITVRSLVEYARCSPPPAKDIPHIELGGLIDRTTTSRTDSTETMEQKILLGYDQLNKHCFVSGVTGSGKSTTMRRLLREITRPEGNPIPFMVIEPAKSEYRALKKEDHLQDLVVYSLGRPTCDYSINPFSFPEGVDLFSHLDFLKSAFNALLGSYSSMPFILETILCKCYEERGWDLATGEINDEVYRKSLMACPTEAARWQLREERMPLIGDMADKVTPVLEEFFKKESDYSTSLHGALKARLISLCSSMKGRVLNKTEKVRFSDLLKRNVVFEVEAFADNDEKAFIMSLLLGRIYEHRQLEHQRQQENPEVYHYEQGLRHIVVLEEAHRLLAKTTGKGELQADPRSKAVEIFSDMLAEVRSYGQGMIIVDQIPSKLTPEVMKNTEVKIAHRLLAKDDREAVGATMNLSKDQIEDLARHNPGEATMYFGNLSNALHVKIDQ